MSALPPAAIQATSTKDLSVVRAFLSHTGSDKEFVEAVAKRLGRVACVFDKMCFQLGDDLVQVIQDKLDESKLFVLFASRKSLKSDWVRFEIDLASYARVGSKIRKSIVIALDPDIPLTDYPEWMRVARIVFANSADLAAREVRSHLDMVIASRMQSTFVGRTRECSECEAALAPLNENPPHVLVLYGLEGIGRRTLCRRAVANVLQFRRVVPIGLSSADSLADLAFRLRAELEPPSSPRRLRELQDRIAGLTEGEAIGEVITAFRAMAAHGELPILIDDGGVLTESGEYSQIADSILRAVSEDNETYVAVITPRRTPEQLTNNAPTPTILVRPLDTADTQRLLGLLLRSSEHHLTSQQILAIAEKVKGHPPSAYYAARLVQRYGPDLVERRGALLENFQASTFVRYLAENAALSDMHQRALRLLSVYSPLPLDVLQNALNTNVEIASGAIVELIDLSLVIPREDGLYELAGPVDVAVRRVFGATPVEHSRVASALQDYLEKVDAVDRHLVLCQIAFRAAAYSDANPPPWAVQLARDVLEIARESYYAQDYDRAVKYARLAVQHRPANSEGRRFLIRGLIQLEQYTEAKAQLEYFRSGGILRDYHFLTGFSERHQGHHAAAIDAYNKASRIGYSGVAIHRELAFCHFLLGQVDEARRHIAAASSNDPDNRYLVDLEMKIALASRDLVAASALINRLERIDRPAFVMFRKSMLAYAMGQIDDALRHAERAVAETANGRPTFEMLAQLAKCLIDNDQFPRAAETLVRIDRIFAKRRHDVRCGLWCKWAIAQHEWEEASGYWSRLDDKSRPVHLALRRKIVEGLLKGSGLSAAARDRLEAESSDIKNKLASIGDDKLWLSEMLDYADP